MDKQWLIQDPWICLMVIFSETILALSGLTGILLLAVRFGGIGDLSSTQVLFMLSFHLFGEGIELMFFGNANVLAISRRIGRGQIDHMLVQPIPLPLQLLCEGFIPFTGSQKLIISIFALAYATAQCGITLTAGWFTLLLALALCRITLRIGVSYLSGVLAFYRPVACEEVSDIVLSLCDTVSSYPLSGMPRALVLTLCTALPIGLLTYIPGLILLGKLDLIYSALPLFAALTLCMLATYAFKKGMKYYATVGSIRYKAMGHRS